MGKFTQNVSRHSHYLHGWSIFLSCLTSSLLAEMSEGAKPYVLAHPPCARTIPPAKERRDRGWDCSLVINYSAKERESKCSIRFERYKSVDFHSGRGKAIGLLSSISLGPFGVTPTSILYIA